MTHQSDTGLKDYINREILPRLEAMSREREQKSTIFYRAALGSTLALVVGLAVAGVVFEIEALRSVEFATAVVVVALFGVSLHAIFHILFIRGAQQRYVEEVVAPLIDYIRPGVDYEPDAAIEREQFEASAIAQLPLDRYRCRGQFTASRRGGRLRFAEVVASCRVKKRDQSFAANRTCFVTRGLFFIAPLRSSPKGTTVIAPSLRRFVNADALPRARAPKGLEDPPVRPAEDWPYLGWLPENHDEPMRPVTLPDPEFDAHFDVWSTQVVEARQFLHPQFIERLKQVHAVWHSDAHRTAVTQSAGQGYFVLVVRDGHIYLSRAMPRQWSEIRSFSPDEQVELLVQFCRDIRLGIELLESLDG